MIYLISFIFFLLFVAGLSIGLLRNKPLKSEDEATNAILEGMTCASCHGSCGFAGGKENHASDKCKAARLTIPHRDV